MLTGPEVLNLPFRQSRTRSTVIFNLMGKRLSGFSLKFHIQDACVIALLEGSTVKHLQLKSSKESAMQKHKQRGFIVIFPGIGRKANCDHSYN